MISIFLQNVNSLNRQNMKKQDFILCKAGLTVAYFKTKGHKKTLTIPGKGKKP